MDTSGYTGDQLLLSDDGGHTYSQSYALNQSSMNELQLVQLGNGSVLAVMRNNIAGEHRQAVAVSDDGGTSFGPVRMHPQLVTPTCQGSVLYIKGSTVLYAGPHSPTSRVQMTVLASDDNGETFKRSLEIWPGVSMYSSMQLLPSGEVALLVRKTPLFEPFLSENDQFAKTGWGQNIGSKS